jgi:hypothetical protein
MADLSQLLAALSAGNATIQKQDMYSPFSNVANQIGGLAVQTATPDNWKQAAMASAISGLVGGITGGLGANYQAEQQNLYSQALMNQLSGIQAQPEGISSALFADAQTAANNYKLIEQMQNKAATTNLMNQIAAQGVLSDPRIAQEVTRKVLGVEGNPVRAIATPADAATGETGAIATNTAALPDAQNPIYEMMDKTGRTYQDAAAEVLRQEEKQEKRMGELETQYKDIGEVAQKGAKLLDLATGLESAIERGGDTGFMGETSHATKKALASMGVSDSLSKTVQAEEELGSYAAQIIDLAKKIGTGSMSDPEMYQYLRSGPTLDKTKDTNKSLTDRYRYAGTIDLLYSDFMTKQMKAGTARPEAEAAWSKVRATNPYLVRDEKTSELKPNPFWANASGEVLGRPMTAPIATPAAAANTMVKTTKTGERVLVKDLGGGKFEIVGKAQ